MYYFMCQVEKIFRQFHMLQRYKALKILDGHNSHKNLEALESANAIWVILLWLPVQKGIETMFH